VCYRLVQDFMHGLVKFLQSASFHLLAAKRRVNSSRVKHFGRVQVAYTGHQFLIQ
jgi:hypothetical protein